MEKYPPVGWPGVHGRIYPRYRFSVKADVASDSMRRRGCVSNISRGGMFIQLAEPPPVNTHFSAYLALDKPLRVDCIVRRVVPGLGVGVTITISEEEGRRRFEGLLLALSGGSELAAAGVEIPRPEPPRIMATSTSKG